MHWKHLMCFKYIAIHFSWLVCITAILGASGLIHSIYTIYKFRTIIFWFQVIYIFLKLQTQCYGLGKVFGRQEENGIIFYIPDRGIVLRSTMCEKVKKKKSAMSKEKTYKGKWAPKQRREILKCCCSIRRWLLNVEISSWRTWKQN